MRWGEGYCADEEPLGHHQRAGFSEDVNLKLLDLSGVSTLSFDWLRNGAGNEHTANHGEVPGARWPSLARKPWPTASLQTRGRPGDNLTPSATHPRTTDPARRHTKCGGCRTQKLGAAEKTTAFSASEKLFLRGTRYPRAETARPECS